LESVLYSTNSNAIERILKDQLTKAGLQLEMQGAIAAPDSPQVEGLSKRIKREMERVQKEFYPKVKSQSVSLC
jgi:capsule polysaccharide export protein KpsE/RkpR